MYGCGGTGDRDGAAESSSNAETTPNVEPESSSEAGDTSQASTESNSLDSYFTVNEDGVREIDLKAYISDNHPGITEDHIAFAPHLSLFCGEGTEYRHLYISTNVNYEVLTTISEDGSYEGYRYLAIYSGDDDDAATEMCQAVYGDRIIGQYEYRKIEDFCRALAAFEAGSTDNPFSSANTWFLYNYQRVEMNRTSLSGVPYYYYSGDSEVM